MKVKITVVIDVDDDAWRCEYGTDDATPAGLRADIKSYFEGEIMSSYPVMSGIARRASTTTR
jgi:hypothetical protein